MVKRFVLKFVMFSVVTIFLSCATYKDEIIRDANSAEIHFYAKLPDLIDYKYIKIDIEKNKIIDLLSYIESKDAPFYKCAYQGKVDFLKDGESIMEMEFNINPLCNHIVFVYKDKLISKKLNAEGVKYFSELYKQVPEEFRF